MPVQAGIQMRTVDLQPPDSRLRGNHYVAPLSLNPLSQALFVPFSPSAGAQAPPRRLEIILTFGRM